MFCRLQQKALVVGLKFYKLLFYWALKVTFRINRIFLQTRVTAVNKITGC